MNLVRINKLCLNETNSKVRISKYLSKDISVQNGLNERGNLAPVLFNCTSDCGVKKGRREYRGTVIESGTSVSARARHVNLLGENI
jgi:hypothetical protein